MKNTPEEIPDAPVVFGEHGKAWLFNNSVAGVGLGAWRIRAPWAHPLWHDYAVSLTYLREVEGVPSAKIYLPGATHEIVVHALNPEKPATLDKIYHLIPANFAAQFIEQSDEDAERRVIASIQEICDGILSPDTDFIRHWIARYGDNMVRK